MLRHCIADDLCTSFRFVDSLAHAGFKSWIVLWRQCADLLFFQIDIVGLVVRDIAIGVGGWSLLLDRSNWTQCRQRCDVSS